MPHVDCTLRLRAPQEGVELRSRLAAARGLPIKVKVREHQYCLAFALTDFKLQGRTLRKLILSLSDRKKPPWITICAFYVFISRVRRAASLRLLQRDDEAIKKLEKLRHNDFLYCWEQGYDAAGRWSDERTLDDRRMGAPPSRRPTGPARMDGELRAVRPLLVPGVLQEDRQGLGAHGRSIHVALRHRLLPSRVPAPAEQERGRPPLGALVPQGRRAR